MGEWCTCEPKPTGEAPDMPAIDCPLHGQPATPDDNVEAGERCPCGCNEPMGNPHDRYCICGKAGHAEGCQCDECREYSHHHTPDPAPQARAADELAAEVERASTAISEHTRRKWCANGYPTNCRCSYCKLRRIVRDLSEALARYRGDTE